MMRRVARFASFPSRSASTLVVASHNGKALDAGTLSAVTAAAKIGGDVAVLVSGSAAVAAEARKIAGVAKVWGSGPFFFLRCALSPPGCHRAQVLHAEAPTLDHGLAESNAALVAALVKKHNFSHVVAAADARGKSIVPRAAALLNVGALTDVSSVEGADTFKRPIYAGNAIATVQSTDPVKMLTVRVAAFDKANATSGTAALVSEQPAPVQGAAATWKSEQLTVSARPALQGASIVVSGGRYGARPCLPPS